MENSSIWKTYSAETTFPELRADMDADVAIIGGGICGITTAQQLADAGFDVVVLESARVGGSNTAHSTGNLYEIYGELLKESYKSFGKDKIDQVAQSRREAINLIENNIKKFAIDCDFRRVRWNYYSAIADADSKINEAFNNGSQLKNGLMVTELSDLRFKARTAIKLDGQAQFNPIRYVQGLSVAIKDQCQIYEKSPVIDVQDKGDHHLVICENGQVNCKYVIHATHTPKGFMPVQAMMGPYREYGIACKIREPQHPAGIYFGYHAATEITSTRSYERDGEHFVVVVGEPHKVGQGDTLFHMKRLEDFAAEHFDVINITHRWGGQHYRPADHLPYIGRRNHGSKTLIATGFSTHGLVYGTVAAVVLRDIIAEKANPNISLYDPARFTPIKSAPKFIKENVNVVSQFMKDYLFKHKDGFIDVAPEEGKIVEFDGHKLAVYRARNNQIQVCSAICTHMGCVVHWNNGEKSWDCPCHGSRFATNGDVLEGPALKALARVEEIIQGVPVKERVKLNLESFRGQEPSY